MLLCQIASIAMAGFITAGGTSLPALLSEPNTHVLYDCTNINIMQQCNRKYNCYEVNCNNIQFIEQKKLQKQENCDNQNEDSKNKLLKRPDIKLESEDNISGKEISKRKSNNKIFLRKQMGCNKKIFKIKKID